MVGNVFGGKQSGGKFTPGDLMPKFRQPKRQPQSMEMQQELLIALTIANGGEVELTAEQQAARDAELKAEQQRLTEWFAEEQARWRRDHGKAG